MKTKRAYKYRFYPTPEQEVLLSQTFGCVRFAYNHILRWRTDEYYKNEYKSEWADRTVVEIDRFFPSSKRCHACGFVNESLPLFTREWDCPECKAHHDRDINVAKNIKTAGLAGLACAATGTGTTV